jgi:type I restriction enzyme S subunit
MEMKSVKSNVGMKWEMVKLSNVAEIIAGQSPESKYYNDKGEGIPFFQGKADFRIDYPVVRYWCTQPTKIAKPMDILMSVRAPVGPTNICDVEACIGRGLAAIRSGKKLHYKYLYFYFKTIEDKLSSQGNGSTFSAITTSVIKDLQIPLPPLATQKRIAEILDAADALRRKDQALLQKYDELAQAIFIDMFGDPVKNEKGWEVIEFGNCIKYIGDIGSNGSNATISENIEMLDTEDYAIMVRTTNLNANNFEKNLKYVSEKTYNFFSKSKIFGGEIIMNKIGSAGDFWIMPNLNRPVSLGLNQFVIRLENLNTKYLYYYLSSNYGKAMIKASINGAVTKSITKTAVKALPLLYPSIDLQNKFAEVICLIEEQKNKSAITQSDSLFQTLLQKAFNGALVP